MLVGGKVISSVDREEFFPDGHTKKVVLVTYQLDNGSTGQVEFERARIMDTTYVESVIQAHMDARNALFNLHVPD